jgi:hypothetical protein
MDVCRSSRGPTGAFRSSFTAREYALLGCQPADYALPFLFAFLAAERLRCASTIRARPSAPSRRRFRAAFFAGSAFVPDTAAPASSFRGLLEPSDFRINGGQQRVVTHLYLLSREAGAMALDSQSHGACGSTDPCDIPLTGVASRRATPGSRRVNECLGLKSPVEV